MLSLIINLCATLNSQTLLFPMSDIFHGKSHILQQKPPIYHIVQFNAICWKIFDWSKVSEPRYIIKLHTFIPQISARFCSPIKGLKVQMPGCQCTQLLSIFALNARAGLGPNTRQYLLVSSALFCGGLEAMDWTQTPVVSHSLTEGLRQ